MNCVYTKAYVSPEVNQREILRYIGAREATPEISALVAECLSEAEDKLSYRVCYGEFPLFVGESIMLADIEIKSEDLKKNLSGCTSAIVFAATVGLGIDRLIARYLPVSPAKALVLDGIGAERVESLCNRFNGDIAQAKAQEGYSLRPRFSAGYGDFKIDVQKDIFRLLDCPRKLGLSLNDSMLMSPSKSVTAIIGVCKNGK